METRINKDDEWTYGKPYKTIDAETGEETENRIVYAPMNFIRAAQEVMRARAEKQRRKDIASSL